MLHRHRQLYHNCQTRSRQKLREPSDQFPKMPKVGFELPRHLCRGVSSSSLAWRPLAADKIRSYAYQSEPPAPLLPEEGWPKAGVEGAAGGQFRETPSWLRRNRTFVGRRRQNAPRRRLAADKLIVACFTRSEELLAGQATGSASLHL